MAHFLSHSRDAACESEDMQVLTLVLKLKMLRNYKLGITYYQKGNEILDYFSTGNSEVLKPLILESEKRENKLSDRLRERLYIKKHPNSNLAKEEFEKNENFRKRKNNRTR